MNVVEIGIVHISLMSTDHPGRERANFDFLSLCDDPAERLILNEAVEQVDYSVS